MLCLHPAGTPERLYIRHNVDFLNGNKVEKYELIGSCGEQFSIPRIAVKKIGVVGIPKGKTLEQLAENDVFLVVQGTAVQQWKFLELKKVV